MSNSDNPAQFASDTTKCRAEASGEPPGPASYCGAYSTELFKTDTPRKRSLTKRNVDRQGVIRCSTHTSERPNVSAAKIKKSAQVAFREVIVAYRFGLERLLPIGRTSVGRRHRWVTKRTVRPNASS